MAYASGVRLSSVAGIVGAVVGGYIGYTQAQDVSNLEPVTAAIILGAIGMVAGSAGAFILKSLLQFAIYILLFGVVAYVFQNQIEALTGINPVEATMHFLRDMGIPV